MLISEDCLIIELAKCNEDAYLPSLHLSTVELCCNLQEKLHRVTWPTCSVLIFLFHLFNIFEHLIRDEQVKNWQKALGTRFLPTKNKVVCLDGLSAHQIYYDRNLASLYGKSSSMCKNIDKVSSLSSNAKTGCLQICEYNRYPYDSHGFARCQRPLGVNNVF